MRRVLLFAVILIGCRAEAFFDGAAVELGKHQKGNIDLLRVHALKTLKRWDLTGSLTTFWVLNTGIGYWNNRFDGADTPNIGEVWLGSQLQLGWFNWPQFAPFGEFGMGLHLISDTQVNNQRQFSTYYQFGSHVGGGARFGDKLRYEFLLRIQHLSNASFESPNDGINFYSLRLSYRW